MRASIQHPRLIAGCSGLVGSQHALYGAESAVERRLGQGVGNHTGKRFKGLQALSMLDPLSSLTLITNGMDALQVGQIVRSTMRQSQDVIYLDVSLAIEWQTAQRARHAPRPC